MNREEKTEAIEIFKKAIEAKSNIKDAAKAAGISVQTAYNWLKRLSCGLEIGHIGKYRKYGLEPSKPFAMRLKESDVARLEKLAQDECMNSRVYCESRMPAWIALDEASKFAAKRLLNAVSRKEVRTVSATGKCLETAAITLQKIAAKRGITLNQAMELVLKYAEE